MALAATMLAAELALLEQVLATARRHPRVAGLLGGARAAHRAHVALLTDAAPDGSTPPPTPSPASPVPSRPGAALTELARAESRHAVVGGRAALTARSGPFARVLASMAAGAAQQSAHLTAASRARR